MLKNLLREVEEKVIIPLQTNDISKTKLKKNRKYFYQKVSKIWKTLILEQNKLKEEDIFEHPLAVAYLLNVSSKCLGEVIQEESRLAEFLDFFWENYPEIKFTGDIQEFYETVRNYKL